MSISIWVVVLLGGVLVVLAVCAGMSLDTERQRRERQRVAQERYLMRAEREWLERERQEYAGRLRHRRGQGKPSPIVHRPDDEDSHFEAPSAPVP
jgi:hypothetical protein